MMLLAGKNISLTVPVKITNKYENGKDNNAIKMKKKS